MCNYHNILHTKRINSVLVRLRCYSLKSHKVTTHITTHTTKHKTNVRKYQGLL